MSSKRLLRNIIKNLAADDRAVDKRDTLLDARNRCMMDRYYYYGYYKKKGYEETLHLLEEVFFITARRIGRILMDNSDAIAEVKARKASIRYLQTKWPHLKW